MSKNSLLCEVSSCKVCEKHLPLGARPVISISPKSKIIIIGQAPGSKVHASGKPRDDASGQKLRERLGVDDDAFYNNELFGILPMGFCYPGKGKSGDNPPRPECAPLWHERLLQYMPNHSMILLVGSYAQKYYLGKEMKKTLTETVRTYEEYLPKFFPVPHPSWRSTIRQKKNPRFEKEVLPELRKQVSTII